MDSWADVLAALNALLLLVASGLLAAAGVAVARLMPVLREWLVEWITSRAMGRIEAASARKAAELVDPARPSSSVGAKAVEVMKALPGAMAAVGAGQGAVERVIAGEVSKLRIAASPQQPMPVSKPTLVEAVDRASQP